MFLTALAFALGYVYAHGDREPEEVEPSQEDMQKVAEHAVKEAETQRRTDELLR